MKIRPKHMVLAVALGGLAIIVAAAGVMGITRPAQAQTHTAVSGPQAGPPLCSCSGPMPIAADGHITNCQCGALQCVAIIGAKSGASQAPALVCVK